MVKFVDLFQIMMYDTTNNANILNFGYNRLIAPSYQLPYQPNSVPYQSGSRTNAHFHTTNNYVQTSTYTKQVNMFRNTQLKPQPELYSTLPVELSGTKVSNFRCQEIDFSSRKQSVFELYPNTEQFFNMSDLVTDLYRFESQAAAIKVIILIVFLI